MTREEFLKAITYMGIAYNKEFTQEQVGVWYGFFEDADFERFKSAVKRLINTSRFLPSVADIKAEMAETDLDELTGDQAWYGLLGAISKYGYYHAEEAMAALPDLTRQTVNSLGGFQKICASEMNEWLRKDFIGVYDDMRKRGIRKYVTGDMITIADVAKKKEALERQRGMDAWLLGDG